MRRTTIIAMCALLVAALLSPGVAMAKGGNGNHPVATPKASGKGNSQKPGTISKTAKTANPKAASPQKNAKAVGKPTGTEPDAGVSEAVESPETQPSATSEQSPSAEPSEKAIPAASSADESADEWISSDKTDAADAETHGVLDTIRAKVSASLESIRAMVTGMWSTVSSWFSD